MHKEEVAILIDVLFAESAVRDTTIQVAVISGISLVLVAAFGTLTAKVTQGARKESKQNAAVATQNAEVATAAAEEASQYAALLEAKNAALEAKDAKLETMGVRLSIVEERHRECTESIQELKEWKDEFEESQRIGAVLERERERELADLRAQLGKLQRSDESS